MLNTDVNSYSDEEIKEHIKGVIEKTANDSVYLPLRENARNEYMLKRAGELAYGTAYSVYTYLKESKFKPSECELEFKGETGLAIGEHTTLQGKIDRVDTYEKDGKSYYSIIDYKSSAKTIDYSEVYNGLSLQPLLYLSALIENKLKEGIDAHAAGAFYLKVDDPIVRANDDLSDINKIFGERYNMSGVRTGESEIADALDPERAYIPGDKTMYTLGEKALNSLLEFSNKKAEEILHNMEQGDFDITPIKKKDGKPVCKFCNYRSVCGYDEVLHTDRPITNHQKDALIKEVLQEEEHEQ